MTYVLPHQDTRRVDIPEVDMAMPASDARAPMGREDSMMNIIGVRAAESPKDATENSLSRLKVAVKGPWYSVVYVSLDRGRDALGRVPTISIVSLAAIVPWALDFVAVKDKPRHEIGA